MAADGRKNRDTPLLIALAAGNPVSAAAEQARVSERTTYRRLKDPVFRARLHSMRSEMMASAVGKLTCTMHQAADTLASLLQSESDAIRLGAARAILDLGPKLTQSLMLESRIAQVERRLNQSEAAKNDLDDWGFPLRLVQH